MNFADRLVSSCNQKQSYLMAGIDPQAEMIPSFISSDSKLKDLSASDYATQVLFEYCRLIVEASKNYVAIIKPNIAFFERYGHAGLTAWDLVCRYIKEQDLLILADVKRGDIANTAQAYADGLLKDQHSFLGRDLPTTKLDAVTINPFLGLDTVEPYVTACKESNKGVFVLCRTSNPGAEYLQNFAYENKTISEVVADQVHNWGLNLCGSLGYSSLGVVVGATYPEQAIALRQRMPHNLFLIPGAGTQGADMRMACAGFDHSKQGAIINVSRALVKGLETSQNANVFQAQVAERAKNYRDQINQALNS
jgi:orotidine-5'-phosphate decarboxylase